MEFLFDGWYSEKHDAMWASRRTVEATPGALFVGLVENPNGETWGYLYLAEDTPHENHRADHWTGWIAGA